MRTLIEICENDLFPFALSVWVDFPLIPRSGDTIYNYFFLDYEMLSEEEKKQVSKEDFDKYSYRLSNLVVTGPAWWCMDGIGPFCTLYVEVE